MVLLVFLLILLPHWLTWDGGSAAQHKFIVWNVGQGLWTTEVRTDSCLHFDMGGEKNLSRRVSTVCSNKKQKLFLTHWDWDHINFISAYRKRNPEMCLAMGPAGTSSAHKMNSLRGMQPCPSPEKIQFEGRPQKHSNDQSHVFFSDKILIPGDSPVKMEKIWLHRIPQSTQGLLLGHHGSRSSSGSDLLSHLSGLRWAVASARSKRYGHPHKDTILRLKKQRIPLLLTEDWGNLIFLR